MRGARFAVAAPWNGEADSGHGVRSSRVAGGERVVCPPTPAMTFEEDFDRDGGDARRGELSAWDGDFWVDVEAQERAEGIINALEDLLHGDVPTEQVRCPPSEWRPSCEELLPVRSCSSPLLGNAVSCG